MLLSVQEESHMFDVCLSANCWQKSIKEYICIEKRVTMIYNYFEYALFGTQWTKMQIREA